MNIKGLTFVETCSACPEQYDVMDNNGNQVAYVRLRWGGLQCEVPDCWGEIIYSHGFDDGWMGCFEDEEQREKYLNIIADKINEHYGRSSNHE